MGSLKNRKLCWNCEGSVHVHATKCPFCGTELGGAQDQQEEQLDSERTEELTYAMEGAFEEEAQPEEEPSEEAEEAPSVLRTVALPMLLLLPGAFLLLFGLVLLLFSTDGVLTLSWNAGYWYLYLLLASPLLYFGWKCLNSSESTLS